MATSNGSKTGMGKTVHDAIQSWPKAARPPEGAPNVVWIVLDDLGFAQLGCYGSAIETPHIDRLANGGLRYTNFHVTAMCSPTRTCLLTGRNHHAAGMGYLA
ncbi:MAG: sulfatase-like hydrolase/transferase, partial [Rhodospirillales bacterium]